jgi:formylmethanofuran dehydrogenase subunit E
VRFCGFVARKELNKGAKMFSLKELLEKSALDHDHLCPRQVLGVRMGVYAGSVLELDLPQREKRLLSFVETDGCFADGVSAASGCTVGHRTLRIVDFGKTAATFVDIKGKRSIRITPLASARQLSDHYMPAAKSHWHAQLEAYQVMPDHELMAVQNVTLSASLAEILSRPGIRINCDLCKEEIINQREVCVNGQTLCRSCAGQAYYSSMIGSNLEQNLLEVVYHTSFS